MVPDASSDDRGPLPSRPLEDRVEVLVAQFLDGSMDESDDAVEEFCRRNPAHAVAIRERLKALRDAGLWGLHPATIAEEAPESLGEFRLVRRLGGGGMGVVYLAEQPSLGRRVALKLIRPEYLYFSDSRERFRREVEAVAQLQHPGIVPIHSVGEAKGLPYFAMEHIAGSTLAEVLQRLRGRSTEDLDGRDLQRAIAATEGAVEEDAGRSHAARADPRGGRTLGPDEARRSSEGDFFDGSWEEVCLRVVREVALALDHAHERHVLHRDVKPSNVMITRAGRVLLVDFGLARSEGASNLTRTGSQLGSLPYMSPEQVRGVEKSLDRRTDVYSLGVTLYELLTLESPYDAEDTEVSRGRILEGSPPPLRARNRNLSWEAETVCLTAMERDPARRYGTAAAMARDLTNALERRPIAARRAGRVLRTRRWVQRHPARSVALVLGFLLVVVGPTVIAILQTRSAHQATRDEARVQAAFERAEGSRLTGESTVALATNPGLALLLAIEGAKRPTAPEAGSLDATNLATRNALIAALNSSSEQRALVGHSSGVQWAEFSPDGCSVATASADWTARLWDAASGAELLRLIGHAGPVTFVAFSPNGRLLATTSDDTTARVWDGSTGGLLHVLRGHVGSVRCAVFSPDGARIVTASWDGDARVWSVATGEELALLSGHTDELNWAAFSPDGTRILTPSYDGTACIWDSQTGARLFCLEGHAGFWHGIRHAEYSPDGARIVTASNDRTARVWDAASGRELRTLKGHAREVIYAAFSPDGQWIVTCSYDRTARLWDTETWAEPAVLGGRIAEVWNASFSADSTRVVTTGFESTARLWDVRTGRQIEALQGHTRNLSSARFAPDGARIVTAAADCTARVWDVTRNGEAADMWGHIGQVWLIVISPDGRRLATGSDDWSVRMWDAPTGAPMGRPLTGHENAIISVEFSADGRYLLTASNDRTARIWDAATGAELQILDGHDLWPYFAHFNRDGTRVMTSSGGALYLWDAKTKERIPSELVRELLFQSAAFFADDSKVLAHRGGPLVVFDGHTAKQVSSEVPETSGCRCFVLSPDEKSVVVGYADGSVRVVDLSTWKVSAELRPPSTSTPDVESNFVVTDVLFNSAGDCLASVSNDLTIRMWDWPSLRVRAVLKGFETTPDSVRLSGDGRRLVAVNLGVASVWDTTTGEELATLRRNEAEVLCAEISYDGRRVYLGFADGLVRMWTVPGDPLAEALRRKPRELTAEERERFGVGDGRR